MICGLAAKTAAFLTRTPFYPYFLFFRAEKLGNEHLLKKYVQGILLDVGCGSSNYRQYCLEATQIRQYWGVDYPAWQNNLMKGDALTSASGFVKVLYRHRQPG